MTLLLPDLALARAVVDRDSGRRADAGWLTDAWADPTTRVLRLRDGRAAVVGDPPRLDLDSRPEVSEQHRYLLGTHDGVAYLFGMRDPSVHAASDPTDRVTFVELLKSVDFPE